MRQYAFKVYYTDLARFNNHLPVDRQIRFSFDKGTDMSNNEWEWIVIMITDAEALALCLAFGGVLL